MDLPDKPSGMHWSPYTRLAERFGHQNNIWTMAMIRGVSEAGVHRPQAPARRAVADFGPIREVAQLVIVAPCTLTFQSAHPAQALLALEGKVPALAPQPSDQRSRQDEASKKIPSALIRTSSGAILANAADKTSAHCFLLLGPIF
jgi:hypothetical protein